MILAAALTGHPVAPSYASWHGAEALFACLGVIAVGAALLVVTARNVVHAALWLVVTFGALAGGYLLMTAELVAWVQVLIYIGAVVVMLLFATMLTRAPIGKSLDLDSDNKVLAAIVGLATAATLVFLVIDAFKSGWIDVQHVSDRVRAGRRRCHLPVVGAAVRGGLGPAAGRARRCHRARPQA